MTSAFCLFVFETFVSRLLALFGTIMTSESGNPTPPGDKWERKLLVFGIFYSFLTSGRPLSSSTDISELIAQETRCKAGNLLLTDTVTVVYFEPFHFYLCSPIPY